jgi:hypothetical protein
VAVFYETVQALERADNLIGREITVSKLIMSWNTSGAALIRAGQRMRCKRSKKKRAISNGVIVLVVYFMALSVGRNIEPKMVGKLVKNELEKIWKKAVVV